MRAKSGEPPIATRARASSGATTKIVTPYLSVTQTEKRIIKPVFGKFITRNVGFVDYLNRVRKQIDVYVKRPRASRPLNIFLAAPPGSGKSFLIKQLVSAVNPRFEDSFEEIYVASLDNITELYDVFQRVQSYNLEGKMPVVFFDEIDTPFDGHMLYPKFLAPMWDGTFFVGKEKYFLGKSIFFFAGSTLSLETVSIELIKKHKSHTRLAYNQYYDDWRRAFDSYCRKKGDKLSDFMDRIDAVVRIPPMRKELLGKDLKAEYEDLAIMLILKNFPDVKLIGKWALTAICHELAPPNSVRRAEKMIFSAQLSDANVFDLRCIPEQFLKNEDRVRAGGEPAWEIEILLA